MPYFYNSCNGTFEYISESREKTNCSLGLYKYPDHFSVVISDENGVIFSDYLTETKKPFFDDKSFYMFGNKIFTVEDSSISRFNEVKKLFESRLNVYDCMVFEGNNYRGETKDGVPNGQGILYYGKTQNVMAKSNFVNGNLDGKSILYSKDQNVEIICDDIVNMKPVQYVTVLFKNMKKEIQVDMLDFANEYKTEIHYDKFDKYVEMLYSFAIANSSAILDPHKFLFLNKSSEQQYEEMFDILMQNNKLMKQNTNKIYSMLEFIRCIIILYFPFFLYLLCNMK